MAALLISIVWPAFAFGMLLTIPVLKVVLRRAAGGLLAGYTYDMAVVLLAIIAAALHRARQAERHPLPIPPRVIVAWLVLAVLIWLRLPASANQEYGFKKALIFSIFDTCAVLSVVLMLVTPRDGRQILRLIVMGGILSSMALPLFGSTIGSYEGARFSIQGASPLGVADLAANAILILLSTWIADRSPKRTLLVVIVVPLSALAIFMSGTRGPIFAIPLVLPLIFWFYRRSLNFQGVMAALIGFGLMAVVTAYLVNPSYLTRFSRDAVHSGLSARMHMVNVTLRGIVRNPILGNGTGDTSVQLHGVADAEGSYPHNHLLEVFNELGIFGMIAWVTIMASGLAAGWELRKPEWDNTEAKFIGVALYACFVYQAIQSFKAGTFAAAYMQYFFCFATIAAHELRKRDLQIWRMNQQLFMRAQTPLAPAQSITTPAP